MRSFVFLWVVLCLARFGAAIASAAEDDLVLGVYQGPCRDGDFAANAATVRTAVAEARAKGCHFLAFPETFLSGGDTLEHLRQGQRRLDAPDVRSLISETAAHDMVVMVGLARVEKEGVYNSILVIQRGRLLGIYDKVIPTEGELRELHLLPGKSVPVFEAHGVRFAVVVCHDTSFPHPAMLARLKGAQILFTPHYNCIPKENMDNHRKWTRNTHIGLACHMEMVVARSNVVIPGRQERLGYGDSVVLSPRGEVLAEAGLFRSGVFTARVSRAMIKAPQMWANYDEVPAWLKRSIAEELRKQGTGGP